MRGETRQQRRFVARHGERQVGFTPVPNKRISGRHALEVMRLVGFGINPAEAEQQAWRNIAATLSPPRMVRRRLTRPSKSDNPEYRKSIWPASKIERRK